MDDYKVITLTRLCRLRRRGKRRSWSLVSGGSEAARKRWRKWKERQEKQSHPV